MRAGDELYDQAARLRCKDGSIKHVLIHPNALWELLPRVFDLFSQAGQSLERSQGSLGIGLALVRRILELHEGEVEALSAVRLLAPEIVLLDIGLPRVNGYEVAERLRELGSTARLVAVTGYGQQEDRAQALRVGFQHHLVKPVDPDALLRRFRRDGFGSEIR
jgi:CheY-like chemotaxis protein